MARLVLTLPLAIALAACTRSDPAPSPGAAEAGSNTAANTATSAATTNEPGAASGPVLAMLFTSQGCSSCPPADRVLSEIGEGAFGEDVIPLAFHVDYWNYIGWSDPFSSEQWSTLQRKYGKKIARGRVYTPMLVIDGTQHVVGSRASEARARIDDARARGHATSLKIARQQSRGDSIEANITWTRSEGADIYVAVTESGLETAVRRGENAGRELANDHIVRALVRLEPVLGESRGRFALRIDPSWDRKRLKLVAFAQDPRSLAVLGAASE